MKTFIIIPAYNEEKSIGNVIKSLKKNEFRDIVVIDDASNDNTYEIAKKHKVNVLRHPINRGLGGALGTGFLYCRKKGADIAVTFDADGQHDARDIKRLIRPISQRRADVVIGSRLIRSKGMPLIRKIGNYGLNVITFFLFGVWTTDSQSGLRAFSKKAINKINIRSNRMEVSSEFFHEIRKKKLKYKEIPIKPIYSEYSLGKGQSNLNGINIALKLFLKKFMR